MGSLSFSPSFHLLHSEFSHAAIPELSCAAHPASLGCSFPDAPQLSPLFTTPWEVLFSPRTTCSGCWLGTHWHRAGRASSSSGGMEAAAPAGPGGAPCIPAWSSHFFLLANSRGASYSFFLLRRLLKHPRADPLCVFPGHFLGPGTNLPPSLRLSVRVKVTSCAAGHSSCPAEPCCLSPKFPMRPLSFIFLFFQDCCQLKIQPFDQAVQTAA